MKNETVRLIVHIARVVNYESITCQCILQFYFVYQFPSEVMMPRNVKQRHLVFIIGSIIIGALVAGLLFFTTDLCDINDYSVLEAEDSPQCPNHHLLSIKTMPTKAITGHYATRSGRIVFIVKDGSSRRRLYEYEMPGMKKLIKQYRNRVSAIRWNGRPGIYNVDNILDYRKDARGVIYFLVSWAGAWNTPIWRSEVTMADFDEPPMDYIRHMGVEKTERERQIEKLTRERN